MEKGLELIFKIKKEPKVFINQKSLRSFDNFIGGYDYCAYENNIYDCNCWHGFQEYVEKKYNSHTTHGWAQLIDFYSDSDEEAFDNFFKIFEEFLKMPQKPFKNYFNEEIKPSNYELLKRIYKRPGLYLRIKSLRNLFEFLNGYIYCCKTYNIEENFHLNKFEKHLQKKYKTSNRSWYKILSFNCLTDELCFDKFFIEYSEFLETKLKVTLSFDN